MAVAATIFAILIVTWRTIYWLGELHGWKRGYDDAKSIDEYLDRAKKGPTP